MFQGVFSIVNIKYKQLKIIWNHENYFLYLNILDSKMLFNKLLLIYNVRELRNILIVLFSSSET